MKDWKAIAGKSKELINELKFTLDIISIHRIESELATLESQEVEEVNAEEIIKPYIHSETGIDYRFPYIYKDDAIKAIYEYSQQSSKVSDEMIEKEANNLGGREDSNKQKYVDAEYYDGFVAGAKAHRDNLIK